MSDALTDIARDQKRSRCYSTYLERVKEFLQDPSTEKRQAVLTAAQDTDNVRVGYMGGRTSLSESLEVVLTGLQNRDEQVWMRFLSLLNEDDLSDFKPLSPLADKLIVVVDYGQGFVTLKGEIAKFFTSLIEGKDMRTYDCDKYIVALPYPDKSTTQVKWLGCGASGQEIPTDRPRTAN